MQDALFPEDEPAGGFPKERGTPPVTHAATSPIDMRVRPSPPDPALHELAAALPSLARLGTSSWTYPGWVNLVWEKDYSNALLSKHGLVAYARYPLFRAVSLDRAFYRPMSALQYAAFASQVGDDFRFTVKAPALVTDAIVRGQGGRALQPNPAFLNAELAVSEFVKPALQGLGTKLGALVFEISPLPMKLLANMPQLLDRLEAMLRAMPSLRDRAPGAVVAVEVRDPQWLSSELAAMLRAAGATYCLGLHAKLPPLKDQLPMLRALWPGPLVCRWNLHHAHGAYGYQDAVNLYMPYGRLADEDLETRETLAHVILATARAGHPAYVTIGNKAEGSAPLSVQALAKEIVARI